MHLFLEDLAKKTILDCTFAKKNKYFGEDADTDLLLPSGDEKYMSFWVRDCAMMSESGLISNKLLKSYIEIIANTGINYSDTISLENNLTVPPYSVADHINYDGKPVYFPGTYASGNNQGTGAYGYFPPFCDNYYYIMMVSWYIKQSGDTCILQNKYKNQSLSDTIEKIFEGYNIDKETELCYSEKDAYTVDWGFVDTVKKSGKLLMASLLRYNAANSLVYLFSNSPEKSLKYKQISKKIKENILKFFYDNKTGWFYSATDIGRQYDVWATAFAVYSGVCSNDITISALTNAYHNHTAVSNGYVRHILTDDDFSDVSAWQSTFTPHNTYQNGAYWATPTGWYAYALSLNNKDLAYRLLNDFKNHTEFYKSKGAPFEWINQDTSNFSGLYYGTSGVLPYVGLKKIL